MTLESLLKQVDEYEKALAECKNTYEHYEKLLAQRQKEIKALQNAEKPTGRPFVKGVNEPDDGQFVWLYHFSLGDICQERYHPYFDDKLRKGMYYPTEADCIEGEKRREIRARYEGMGRAFVRKEQNWRAYWDHNSERILIGFNDSFQYAQVYFGTEEACQAAIDTINREYGEGAFEHYILGVTDTTDG